MLNEHAKKDERNGQQYERIIEQLRKDIKEKERDCNNIEMKGEMAKHEAVKDLRNLQEKYEHL